MTAPTWLTGGRLVVAIIVGLMAILSTVYGGIKSWGDARYLPADVVEKRYLSLKAADARYFAEEEGEGLKSELRRVTQRQQIIINTVEEFQKNYTVSEIRKDIRQTRNRIFDLQQSFKKNGGGSPAELRHLNELEGQLKDLEHSLRYELSH